MPEHAMEREAKLDVADGFRKPPLGHVAQASTVKLVAGYWDTGDRRLLRWGHTLRHREASDGSEDGWTLKLGAPPGPPSRGTDAELAREELKERGGAGRTTRRSLRRDRGDRSGGVAEAHRDRPDDQGRAARS